MITLTIPAFILIVIVTLLVGGSLGALVVYTKE